LVMIGVIENISHSTDKMFRSTSCILSAITDKLNVSGHMLIWTFFLVLGCGTRAQSLSASFKGSLERLKRRKQAWGLDSCEPLRIIKDGQFLDQLSEYQLLKKENIPWGSLWRSPVS
jgi:hypothetical protein